MNYTVYKFGGTSVGNAERFRALEPLVATGEPKIVVLSAMAGTTNALVAIAQALSEGRQADANQLIGQLEAQYQKVVGELYESNLARSKAVEMIASHFDYLRGFTLDMFTVHEEKAILAQGELLSTSLFQYYLEERGIASSLMPALDFMRLNADEEPDYEYIDQHIKQVIDRQPHKELLITQGYICRNAFGEVDNLKRGGSDFTATIIGAVLQSPEIQIWTDIDGMHNNDPRVVRPTFPITRISYDEAAELAYFGARILHPTCVLPAQKAKVPIRLLNTLKPEAAGTIISEQSSGRDFTAVAAKDGITAINIRSGRMLLAFGFLRSVFEVFERYRTPIDMITTSEVAVSLTIDKDEYLEAILTDLQQFGATQAERNQTIICIVGDFGPHRQELAFRILEALRSVPLRMISYGGSQHNISVLVATEHKRKALEMLNQHLFLTQQS